METIYKRIFETTPDALLVVDHSGYITLVKARAENLFGYDRSELVGQPIEKLVPPRYVSRHAEHRAGFMGEGTADRWGLLSSFMPCKKAALSSRSTSC